MSKIEPLIIRPSDLTLKVTDLSEKVIANLMKAKDFDVIGLGDAIFLACSAVNITTDIANAYINGLSIDNFEIPVLGSINAIFIGIGREPEIDTTKRIEEEEKGMTLTTGREGQVIAVRRGAPIERLVTLCLIKLSKVAKLKIIAAASAINDAVELAINMTKGPVSKEPIGVSFMDLYPIAQREDPQKKMTAISIYLQKGQKTICDDRHRKLVKTLEAKLKGK